MSLIFGPRWFLKSWLRIGLALLKAAGWFVTGGVCATVLLKFLPSSSPPNSPTETGEPALTPPSQRLAVPDVPALARAEAATRKERIIDRTKRQQLFIRQRADRGASQDWTWNEWRRGSSWDNRAR
jgi:hypothetical protein